MATSELNRYVHIMIIIYTINNIITADILHLFINKIVDLWKAFRYII